MQHKILITGGLGYIGAMLVHECARNESVSSVLVIDKNPSSSLFASDSKVTFIQANLADNTWQKKATEFAPDIVIHTAWQIRELYGKSELQTRWNINGSENLFDFVFRTPSVKKLVHFSTVASYGAYPTNTFEHHFTENEPLRKTNYRYAEEKRVIEESLKSKYEVARSNGTVPQVFVVRPASITGPRSRSLRERFGLQSALTGRFKKTSFFHALVSLFLKRIPLTKKWCRQFVHEDDIVDAVILLAFSTPHTGSYDILNLCPPGPITTGEEMAQYVHKKPMYIAPWIIRIAFFILWHISCGKIPTGRGGWKSYAYPIVVDGSKITTKYGYQYFYTGKQAFTENNGRYLDNK